MVDQPTDRETRANRYFEKDLDGQREWYGKRASAYKNYSQLLSLFVLGTGAGTSFLQVFAQVFPGALWVPVVTAALGALVTLTEGWQRIARYGEVWVAYRTASERMKRERRLYINGAGAYRGLDDDAAYLALVESVEAILAEEQQVYWRVRGREGGEARQAGLKAVETEPKMLDR